MQFTTSTIALVASLMASTTSAMPLTQRAQTCGSSPTASGSQTPLSQPSAATAAACEAACTAATGCQSYVFGLPSGASAPNCELFSVPASQVPAQGTNLMVFDVACSNVPTTAPTSEFPIGQTAAAAAASGSSNTGGSSGSNTGNTGSTGSTGGNTGSTGGQPKQKRNTCGAAPSGPATSSPSPLQTNQNIADEPACLALCKATSGCQSIEFGKAAAGAAECKLFNVPASSLPAPATGETFTAFDVGC